MSGSDNNSLVPFRCNFASCQARAWLQSMSSQEDYLQHLLLHRCQVLVMTTAATNSNPTSPLNGDGTNGMSGEPPSYRQCNYLPQSESDLWQHLEEHMAQKDIPTMRSASGKTLFFCPWQTCTSVNYTQKGTFSRTHIVSHMRKHTVMGTNAYSRSSDGIQDSLVLSSSNQANGSGSSGLSNCGAASSELLSMASTPLTGSVHYNPIGDSVLASAPQLQMQSPGSNFSHLPPHQYAAYQGDVFLQNSAHHQPPP